MAQVSDAIQRELDDAREADRPVASVRVSESALPGAVAAVSLSPERAAALRLDAVLAERAVEVLLHPDDYEELLDEDVVVEGEVPRVFGVPLIVDQSL
ncbi:hypothetical protein DVA67_004390 [Solirubrobacter sp. CPCC 204708]|uniref:Uncharacterized protein n=1 Tax=Solirubrobacter deserti TaxID=2282478 RepID=A0ABT4RH77_9ACTN|nr:hypothetical protein [Solirubrobacter deserti]MBE2315200.1 hypothetical protein [Solirubrobacter deserti]MDA0137883.1 hypothetical protein [Solirubrobacter deserti]